MKLSELKTQVNELWQNLKARQWTWVIAAMLCGFLAFYFDASSNKVANAEPSDPLESPATYIPAGFVLVPIEVANFESLDSILGKFGIVDLYIPSEDPKKRARKVGEKLKILRAPLNPSRFAVLVREEDSPRLVAYNGAFVVVVQNPNKAGTGIVNSDNEAPEKYSKSGHHHSRISVEVLDANEK